MITKKILFNLFSLSIKTSFILILYSIILFIFPIIILGVIEFTVSNKIHNLSIYSLFIIIIINTLISLSFIIENNPKELVNRILLGITPIFALFIVGINFINKDNNVMLDLMLDGILLVLILSGSLLINILVIICISILVISIIPKYKKKYKERLIPYCKLAIYSTFFAGIFGYLLYVYN